MRKLLPLDLEKGGKLTERILVMIGLIHAGYRAATLMAACAYKFHSFFSGDSRIYQYVSNRLQLEVANNDM